MKVKAKCTGSFTILLPKYEFIDGNGFREVEDTAFLRGQILGGKAVLFEEKEEAESEPKKPEEPAPRKKRKN